MKHLTRPSSSESGSVLMEFILVAPLYMLLFGGLLLTSEVLLLKNKVMMLDSFVTISGTHRLMQGDQSAQNKQIKSIFAAFMPGSVSSPNRVGTLYEQADGNILANHWNAVFGGRIDVEYKMPTLIYEALSLQCIMFGNEADPPLQTSFKFYPDPKTGNFPGEEAREYRYHLVQRSWMPDTGEKAYDRAVSAKKLVQNNVMSNVLGDGWLFTKGEITSVEDSDSETDEYKQSLGEYAE